jgi:hypothetical protein
MIKKWFQKLITKNGKINNIFKYNNIIKEKEYKYVECFTIKDNNKDLSNIKIKLDDGKQKKIKLNEFQILEIKHYISDTFESFIQGEIYLSEEQRKHYDIVQGSISKNENIFDKDSLEFVMKDIEKSTNST